jgi:transcriptional regulator with XRE-family HTH domain
MTNIQFASAPGYARHAGLAQRLAHVFSRSAAMGLLTGAEVTELSPSSVRGLVADLQQHGLANGAGISLAPLMHDAAAPWDDATERLLENRLDQLAQVLEDSPAPATEWPSMREVLGDDLLAGLLEVSASSLRRYATGERSTPEPTAARLHWLAMVVSDLAGGYNHLGMRRWFERPRAQLSGQSPRAALGRDWQPDDPAAQNVRALAAALSGAQPLAV